MDSLIRVDIHTGGKIRPVLSDWMDANCIGSYYIYTKGIFFDNEQDAVLFTLRWGGNFNERSD